MWFGGAVCPSSTIVLFIEVELILAVVEGAASFISAAGLVVFFRQLLSG